jgi:hypothetical protein
MPDDVTASWNHPTHADIKTGGDATLTLILNPNFSLPTEISVRNDSPAHSSHLVKTSRDSSSSRDEHEDER